MPGMSLANSVESAVTGADAAVVLTEWPEFRAIAWQSLAGTMRRPLVIDLRNIYDAEDIARQGLEYVALGRREAGVPYRAAAE